MSTGLMVSATPASAHSCHEAIGDGRHIGRLFAIGASGIVAVYTLKRAKRGAKD
ncbi:hypothetical protein [Marinobacter sp. SS13-12]|uniref:hypothetical protein n=1 Tax=Marinobacter sp. SS13-12 TaxID=3050451 RepID=UPI002556EA2F|nr:hypothetical protein [Marinobacter sp. SS13-12]MDK8463430.1 hypothetical protein [Marinobacter sp. SS13-12]